MAYRKTEKVLATLEARRNSILASAIDVIARAGMEGLTTDAVAQRAGVATGLMYKYFPDKTELIATLTAQLLARDIAAMRKAAAAEKDPIPALAMAMMVFFNRLTKPRLAKAMAGQEAYCVGIRAELQRLIRASIDLNPKERAEAAAGALGALYGLSDGSRNRAPEAVQFALRGIGVSDAVARRLIKARYSNVPA